METLAFQKRVLNLLPDLDSTLAGVFMIYSIVIVVITAWNAVVRVETLKIRHPNQLYSTYDHWKN